MYTLIYEYTSFDNELLTNDVNNLPKLSFPLKIEFQEEKPRLNPCLFRIF